jgi:protein transport protein SEC61 subunit gamma and related proteins
MPVKQLLIGLKSFAIECSRVLKVTKKPTNEEFKVIVKVSALGMLLIGFIGFLIQLIRHFLF